MTAREAADEGSKEPSVRKGQNVPAPDRATRVGRLRQLFAAPAFDAHREAVEEVVAAADASYEAYEKHARTVPAGDGFARPDVEVATEWLRARAAIERAAAQHADAAGPARVLVVCGSPRNDQTCPGEMSKTWRLTQLVHAVVTAAGAACDVLDLSRVCSDPALKIHPCKSCVSTAMPLCHWPCSCYPNHALGQVQDWMNDIYPLWVAAHGIVLVTPVQWYSVPSPMKAMIDRLVCADGGNPDYTSSNGKDPAAAKRMELAGWHYPKHLAGRAFGVVVHGDAAGADTVKDALVNWLQDMALVSAGPLANIARYIGYYKPYATSHDELDADLALQEEVRNVARAVLAKVGDLRKHVGGEPALAEPRPK